MPRETASTASEARRAKAQAARRERRPWMADANVRRRGTANPEPGAGQGSANPRGPRACGWSIGRGGKSLVAAHRFRTATRAVQGGRRDRGLLERSPTPASSCARAKRARRTTLCNSARGRPCHRSGPRRQARPWMAKRRRRGVSGGLQGRSERPATWHCQSRAWREPAPRATDQAAARITETTAAVSCSPSADRGDRFGTSCPCPHVRPHGNGTQTAL